MTEEKDFLQEIVDALDGARKQCQELLADLFGSLRVPERLDMDEWADMYRVIPDSASSEPGPWRTDRFPFHREIMKALSPSTRVKFVDVMKGAQLGFTELSINHILYVADHAPAPMLYVQKTKTDIEDFSKARLQPSIDACEAVSKKFCAQRSSEGSNSLLMKTFPGGFVKLGAAEVASSLRSRSIGNLDLDEIDSYKVDLQHEGDPVLLAERRTANFPNAKIYRITTPTLTETSRMAKLFELGDQRYYYVPCPHCNANADRTGTYFNIKWKNIKWEDEDPETAQLVCESCGVLISEHFKTWMLENGEWRPHKPHKPDQRPGDLDVEHASFHINALYSPVGFFSWSAAVRMFIEAHKKKDKNQLKVFVNTVLGETWSETGEGVAYDLIEQRREHYAPDGRFQIPKGAVVLLCGADVQRNRIECEVVAYGAHEESWSIEYAVFMGDTLQDQVWQEFDLFLQRTWMHETGKLVNIMCTTIDSGDGGTTDRVYAFCRTRAFRRVYPVKGKYGWGNGLILRPKDKNKDGVWLFTVYVDEVKSKVYSQLHQGEPGPQYAHFPMRPEYNEHYFKMLTW